MRQSPGRQAARSKPRHPSQWNDRPKDIQALAPERDHTARTWEDGTRGPVSLQGPVEGGGQGRELTHRSRGRLWGEALS